MSDSPEDEEEIMVMLEVSSGEDEYRLTVRSLDGKPIPEGDFITHIEMWLHEIQTASEEKTRAGVVH
jgi:hypothetical protein